MNSGFTGLFGLGNPVQLYQSPNFNPTNSTIQSSNQNQHSFFNYFNRSSSYYSTADKKIKVKRTRQRVDAGQPRNTYSTVPINNNQMRTAMITKGSPPYLVDHNGPTDSSGLNQANIFGAANCSLIKGYPSSQQTFMMNRMVTQMIGNSFAPQIPTSSVTTSTGIPCQEPPAINEGCAPVFSNNMQISQLLRFQAIMASNAAVESKLKAAVKSGTRSVNAEPPVQSTATDLSVKTWNMPTPALSIGTNVESVSHLYATSTPSPEGETEPGRPLDWPKTSSPSSSTVSYKSKRKQYLPRPAPRATEQDFDSEIEDNDDVAINTDDVVAEFGEPPVRKKKVDEQARLLPLANSQLPSGLESLDDPELKAMQQQIVTMQQRYAQLLKGRTQYGSSPRQQPSPPLTSEELLNHDVKNEAEMPENDRKSGEIESLGHHLRSELTTNVELTVDKVLAEYLQMIETARSAFIAAQQTAMQKHQQTSMFPNPSSNGNWTESQRNLYLNYYNAINSYANATSGLNSLAAVAAQSSKSNGIFPVRPEAPRSGLPVLAPFGIAPRSATGIGGFAAHTSLSNCSQTQDSNIGALPLLAKKRRSKVTDSRTSKVSASAPFSFVPSRLSAEESFMQTGFDRIFQTPPSMVSCGLTSSPQTTHYGIEIDGRDMEGISPLGVSDGTGSETGSTHNSQLTSTLTPMHLRKAKLMFFYVRYPSSQVLKAFFQDIWFDKNNTAQLVKWFSNFREFYYIQMEKYARQALAEGVRSADEITVNVDSELYRVLNVHYNRNNHIQFKVPIHFREVVQATLREFFKSIQANRDAEQSWKKTIYKIIAKLDNTIPEYFKTTSFMEQLGFPDQ